MRVLITSVGSRGDVQPMVALALRLKQRGHDVLVAAPPNFSTWVTAHGLRFEPLGFDIYEMARREKDLAQNPLRAIRVMTAVIRDDIPVQFSRQRELIPEFDRVIATGLNFAATSVAEWAGKPCHFAVFAPGMLPSAQQPPALLPWVDPPRFLNGPSWWAVERLFGLALGAPVRRGRHALGLEPDKSITRLLLGDHVFVAIDPHLARIPDDVQTPHLQTGAWTMGSTEALAPEIEAFLTAGPPPIYIGFGSVPNASPGETTQLFLDACRRAGTRAIISRGWAHFATEPLPDGFLAIDNAPHEQLFPRVAAVVHHGGSGTTHAAARAGVPQVVVPHGADQFYWGGRVAKLGVGPAPVEKTRLSPERLTTALRQVLEEAGYREAAARLGEQLRPIDGVAAAVTHIEGKQARTSASAA